MTRALAKASHVSMSQDTPSLLVQLGTHAAARFAGRLAALKLAPAHAAMIEILAARPGMSQCMLAELLGTIPSRMVAYVDELEGKGLLERRPHKQDRRNNALFLTKAGNAAYRASFRIAQEHQQALLAGLSRQQQIQLAELLQIVADQQGLTSGAARISRRRPRAIQHDGVSRYEQIFSAKSASVSAANVQ